MKIEVYIMRKRPHLFIDLGKFVFRMYQGFTKYHVFIGKNKEVIKW